MGTWQVFIDEEDGWTVVTEDELLPLNGTYIPNDGNGA